jgi:G protein beta subunit-like protein
MIQDTEVTRIVPIATFQAHKDYLTRVLLSPDVKHLATCSADHTAKIWNLDPDHPPAKAAAAAAKSQPKPSPNVNGAVQANGTANGASTPTSSDSQTLAGTNTASTPQGSSSDLVASDFSMVGPQSSAAAASKDQPQQSFPAQPDGPPMDPTTGTLFLETTLANHQRWVWDCAFSADSAYLVTVSSDHYARLWELSTGQIIRQYSGHHRGAVCVALNDYSEPR